MWSQYTTYSTHCSTSIFFDPKSSSPSCLTYSLHTCSVMLLRTDCRVLRLGTDLVRDMEAEEKQEARLGMPSKGSVWIESPGGRGICAERTWFSSISASGSGILMFSSSMVSSSTHSEPPAHRQQQPSAWSNQLRLTKLLLTGSNKSQHQTSSLITRHGMDNLSLLNVHWSDKYQYKLILLMCITTHKQG